MLYTQVDPETFIHQTDQLPAHGRGAWNKVGIDFDYRYAVAPTQAQTIGTRAEEGLAYWCVAAGSHAIQRRLVALKLLEPLPKSKRGVFDAATKAAVQAFQAKNTDPINGKQLETDGTVGVTDARALFTPMIYTAEARYQIPDKLLLGETRHESGLDPGAVGYYIYYPEYRGVDRGMSQINSRANQSVAWVEAFTPKYAFDWSGKRMRTYYDMFKTQNPRTSDFELWNAAVCAHNNPSAAQSWAEQGHPPTDTAAKYVQAVRLATY